MPLYTFDLFYVIGHLPLFYLLIENSDKIILNSKLETSKYISKEWISTLQLGVTICQFANYVEIASYFCYNCKL